MSPWRFVLAFVVAVFALPTQGQAQGLGDVAARAREERVKKEKESPSKGEVRSYTNDDLPEREESDDDDDSYDPDDGGSSERDSSRGSGSMTAAERAEEIGRARTRVQRLEAKVEELQQKLNPMSTTYIYGGTGGPVGGTQADEEMAIRRQLDATQEQLDDAQDDLEDAEAAGPGSGGGRPEPERDQDEGTDY